MQRTLLLAVLFGALLIAGAADLAWHYPQLPARVATHFNAAGEPDGWASKATFLVVQVVILILLPALLAGTSALVRFLPAQFINLPHREYWLAPPREVHTRAVLADSILVIGLLIFAPLLVLTHLVMRANLAPAPHLGLWPWLIFGVNLAVVIGVMGWLAARFRKPR